MSAELTQDPQLARQTETASEFVPPPTDLPYDDGEPLESNRHRIAMNVLIAGVHAAFADRNDYFAGGNMFLYYSKDQAMNRDFRGPDFFVTLGVDRMRERKYWAIWEEQGRYPDVIVELMSPSTRRVDLTEKKRLYAETFRTREYFVYDPFEADSLQGWRLDAADRYQEIVKNEPGWCWCQELGLWLGSWQGELTRETAPWLRFYDPEGNLILLPEEQRDLEQQRAEVAEEQRDLERQEKEREQQRAERAEEHAMPSAKRVWSRFRGFWRWGWGWLRWRRRWICRWGWWSGFGMGLSSASLSGGDSGCLRNLLASLPIEKLLPHNLELFGFCFNSELCSRSVPEGGILNLEL